MILSEKQEFARDFVRKTGIGPKNGRMDGPEKI